jgi:hypothetical protein
MAHILRSGEWQVSGDCELTGFRGEEHGFWTEGTQILDALELTDFVRGRWAARLYCAAGAASVVPVAGSSSDG